MNALQKFSEWIQARVFMDKLFGRKTVWVRNPLEKYRNLPCLCLSGLKAKKCCGQYHALPLDVAKKVRAALDDWEANQ